MNQNLLVVKGARVHNLKNLNIQLPKRSFVVFTGPSGSGKSSLAFDTLFAEGQRRYVESMSVYARQFLGQMEKPDYDEIVGLSPTISIEQKSISHNPRSTVGTITEIWDHLRVLWARLGVQHSLATGLPVGGSSREQIVDELMLLDKGTRFALLSPLIRNRKGEFRDLFTSLRSSGFTRVRIDGELKLLEDVEKLRKQVRHTIDVVVDRLIAHKGDYKSRLSRSVETALDAGDGMLVVRYDSGDSQGGEKLFSTRNYCPESGIAYPDLTQQSFSFNSPLGWCPECRGLGTVLDVDPDRIVPDRSAKISKGAIMPGIKATNREERFFEKVLDGFCKAHDIPRNVPWNELPVEQCELLMRGVDAPELLEIKGRKRRTKIRFEGLISYVRRRYDETDSDWHRERYRSLMAESPCPECKGERLRAESRAVLINEMSITNLSGMSILDAEQWFAELGFEGRDALIADELLGEIRSRLRFLREVGLGYLSLSRPGPTLSGGEAQRIRLASQLGSELTGVLYILDEPSIGLHQRDNLRLLGTLLELRDQGNSVLVVEHDQETMERADFLVDFGPGAGVHGGEIMFAGAPSEILESEGNVTGDYLAGRREIEVPDKRRKPTKKNRIRIFGARENNLADVDVDFPLGLFLCVTGVSGAGKSTLVNRILHAAAANHHYKDIREVGAHDRITGLDLIDKVIKIDQEPIGRTPRSNPATYTKLFDEIRAFFARLPDSQIYGYKPGRFSFNVAGGRCETCSGAGLRKIEMNFLADVYVTCEVCRGKRFNEATLRVRYEGKSIADVLSMPVEDAVELFSAHPKISRKLQTLVDVGLGYITLGQPSTTLSGGEAQRIKLARELSKIATGDTLYILDEPSTGLHFEDIRKLLLVIQRLVDAGNTVVVIEHNLDIIKAADLVIDVGPEGGRGGGKIVASGTPEEVARVEESHTGRYLRPLLGFKD